MSLKPDGLDVKGPLLGSEPEHDPDRTEPLPSGGVTKAISRQVYSATSKSSNLSLSDPNPSRVTETYLPPFLLCSALFNNTVLIPKGN